MEQTIRELIDADDDLDVLSEIFLGDDNFLYFIQSLFILENDFEDVTFFAPNDAALVELAAFFNAANPDGLDEVTEINAADVLVAGLRQFGPSPLSNLANPEPDQLIAYAIVLGDLSAAQVLDSERLVTFLEKGGLFLEEGGGGPSPSEVFLPLRIENDRLVDRSDNTADATIVDSQEASNGVLHIIDEPLLAFDYWLRPSADIAVVDDFGGGRDAVLGSDRGDDVRLGGGNDLGATGAGDDEVRGGSGDDTVYGGFGDDTVRGGKGRDWLFSENGENLLLGGRGRDLIEYDLFGGSANSTLIGGRGADNISVSDSLDPFVETFASGVTLVYGGAGDDLVQAYRGSAINAYGEDGDDELLGGWANDLLVGGKGDDVVEGDEGDDTLSGGRGADFLDGEGFAVDPGDDLISGGKGRDTLVGGTGDDTLTGGKGRDTFRIEIFADFGDDVITDFDPERDKIQYFIDEEEELEALRTATGKSEGFEYQDLLDAFLIAEAQSDGEFLLGVTDSSVLFQGVSPALDVEAVFEIEIASFLLFEPVPI